MKWKIKRLSKKLYNSTFEETSKYSVKFQGASEATYYEPIVHHGPCFMVQLNAQWTSFSSFSLPLYVELYIVELHSELVSSFRSSHCYKSSAPIRPTTGVRQAGFEILGLLRNYKWSSVTIDPHIAKHGVGVEQIHYFNFYWEYNSAYFLCWICFCFCC